MAVVSVPNFQDLILFENDRIIVIDKPSGMASLDDKDGANLQQIARDYDPELRLCHRLDKLTSGTLILAKDAEAYRDMSLQFQYRKVHKYYLALVAGVHHYQDHEIDLSLHVTTNKKVYVSKFDGKPASTIVNTVRAFRSYTLLRCEPVTGRMHQIRVHLSAQGCPIVGDELYGGKDLFLSSIKRKFKPSTTRDERPLNHGFLLHASAVSFQLPESEESITVEAELPKNFAVVMKQLEKNDR
ncbi:MAG: RluA family pseudouridine synthase [Bacteroidia bacterium]|nr:RluA family pseudouridine synthase [Bacteroidia bacterium]